MRTVLGIFQLRRAELSRSESSIQPAADRHVLRLPGLSNVSCSHLRKSGSRSKRSQADSRGRWIPAVPERTLLRFHLLRQTGRYGTNRIFQSGRVSETTSTATTPGWAATGRVALAAFVFCSVAVAPNPIPPVKAAAEKPKTAEDKTIADIKDRIEDGFYNAQMSIRYHQGYAGWYGGLDQATRAAALILSVIAFCGPFIRMPFIKRKWRRVATAVWLSVGLAALTFSLVLNVFPFGENYQKHAICAQRWNALSSAYEQLKPLGNTVDVAEVERELARLKMEQKSIEDAEPPGYNDAYLAECQRRTNKALGLESEASKLPEYQ
jgi:hypothetical protein